MIISGGKFSGWCSWPAAQILKVEMLSDILAVCRYENIQVDLGSRSDLCMLLSMEGNKWLYQGSILSKEQERVNRCHINKLVVNQCCMTKD